MPKNKGFYTVDELLSTKTLQHDTAIKISSDDKLPLLLHEEDANKSKLLSEDIFS